GLYTHHMSRHSKFVYAFEPMARYVASLRRSFLKNVIVEAVGLSNSSGRRTLRTPPNNRTMATMEEKNTLPYALSGSKILEEEITVKRLDDCGIQDIGFIKVDAEGHELEVLQGASATLKRDAPALLIELVDSLRPNSIRDVTAFLKEHGYQGFSLRDSVLYPIATFDPAQLQKQENLSTYGRRGVYYSNFVFIRPEHMAGLKDYLDPGSTAWLQ
ncbi:MAG: FkbM family methyltransferase, partial [Chloroflexi bacterium]|nr:FkbM family methyltransferase [Chloroflexota bacterium]